MLTGPTNYRRLLGADLRQMRERRSMRIEDVAGHLGVAASTVSRIETGKAPTKTSYLKLLLDLYGVDDPARRRDLANLAREGQRKGWWAADEDVLMPGFGRWLGLETEAAWLRVFGAMAVPVLLRTRAYADAVVAASRPELSYEQRARYVALLLRRQAVLDRAGAQESGDPFLDVVLDEAVLLRAMGPPGLMRDQLIRIAQTANRPGVTVRVLTLAEPRARPLVGSFMMLGFQAGEDVASTEGPRGPVIEQRPAQVADMSGVFESLARLAMPPSDSLAMISELANEAVTADRQ